MSKKIPRTEIMVSISNALNNLLNEETLPYSDKISATVIVDLVDYHMTVYPHLKQSDAYLFAESAAELAVIRIGGSQFPQLSTRGDKMYCTFYVHHTVSEKEIIAAFLNHELPVQQVKFNM